ncbi:CDKN2A-interacting protein [Rhinoraja longicauda]
MAADTDTAELLQERPVLAAWLEALRGGSENQRHWEARRRFIINNLPAAAADSGDGEEDEPDPDPDLPPRAGPRTDRLLALSMAWANHVFLGCRYSKAVMDKVLEMGEGIKVTDAPVHTTRDELAANKKKREIPTSDEKAKEEPSEKKKAVPEVKTIDFVALAETAENVSQEVDPNIIPGLDGFPDSEPPAPLPEPEPEAETPACPVPAASSNQKEVQPAPKETEAKKVVPPAPVPVASQPVPAPAPRSDPPAPAKNCSSNTAEVKPAVKPDNVEPLVPAATVQKVIPQPAASQSCKQPITVVSLTPESVKEKQSFYNKLYKAIAWKLVSVGGFGNDIDHLTILSNCIQATKGTLESVCIPLKDISELHLPQSAAREGIVCELRCQAVYLATGYGKCKASANDMAAKEAVKLFLKQKVTVKMCKRKFKGSDIEDLVLLSEDIHRLNLAPALMNPLEPSAR